MVKDTAKKLAHGISNFFGKTSGSNKQNNVVISDPAQDGRSGENRNTLNSHNRHSGESRNPSLHPETVDPGVRQSDVKKEVAVPPIFDEMFSANRRSAQYLASRTDMQDFPRW